MTAHQKTCPACGGEFTWTSAAPRQKFCNSRCKNRWWDKYRRHAVRALTEDGIRQPPSPPPAGDPGATTCDRRGSGPRGHDPATIAATPACPHCRQPVAIVAWLIPPAAANVATPQATSPRHADTAP